MLTAFQRVVLLIETGISAQVIKGSSAITPTGTASSWTSWTTWSTGASRRISAPTGTIVAEKPLFEVGFIQLLDIWINTPVLAIDVELNKIGFSCRDVGFDLVEVKDLAEKGRILETVIEVQGFVAKESLILVHQVEGNVEGFFLGIACHGIGGLPLKSDPNAVEHQTIYEQGSGEIGFGGIIGSELAPVVGLWELQFDGSDGSRVVQSGGSRFTCE